MSHTRNARQTYDLDPVAVAAARAARNWRKWGAYAAGVYARRNNVPLSLLTTARVLAAAERAGL